MFESVGVAEHLQVAQVDLDHLPDRARFGAVVAVRGLAFEDEQGEGGSLVFQSLQFYCEQVFPLL